MSRSGITQGAVMALLAIGSSSQRLVAQSAAPSLSRPAAHEAAVIGSPRRDFLASMLERSDQAMSDGGMKVDLGPALDFALTFLHQHGIPLRKDNEDPGQGIAFSATFQMSAGVEPMQFHIG